jgi:F-type H+-transporting ATPase subunit alpha
VAGRLRLDLAQYRELAAFAQFASDLDKRTRDQLERGKRMTELLKQPQYEPVPIPDQIIAIFAGTNGYLDDVPVEQISAFERELVRFMKTTHPQIGDQIAKDRTISAETDKALRAAIEEFRQSSPMVQKPEAQKPAAQPEAPAPAGRSGPLQRAKAAVEREVKKES